MKLPAITIPTLYLVFSLSQASATTVAVANIDQPVGAFQGFVTPISIATSFTTGSQTGLALDSLFLSMVREPSSTVADAISVQIFSDASGVPGSSLGALSGPTIPASTTIPTPFLFTTSSAISLAPATTYWVVLSGGLGPGAETTYWVLTNNNSESAESLPGWSIGNNVLDNLSGWTESFAQPGRMAIVVIPEPSAFMLSGLAGIGLLLRRRK